MLGCGMVCISLSLVSTFVLTTILRRKDAAEPVVSDEDRLELQKDVAAAEVLAAVAAVLYMSYLWRALFCRPAPQPQPTLQDFKEEKEDEVPLLRRPSEHKETQYQSSEEAQYVAAETQTADYLLPLGWKSSDTHFSDSSLSETARPSDTQLDTSGCFSSGAIQQSTSEAHTGGTSPNSPMTSTTRSLPNKETVLDSMVQEVLELQVCRTSGGPRGKPPVRNVAPYLPVESLHIETSEVAPSQPPIDLQIYATPSKAQLPPNAGGLETPPNSANDLSSPEAETGRVVIREAAAHALRKPETFTVSLEADQSPRVSTPSPRPAQRISGLPTATFGPNAGKRRVTCFRCRPQAGSQASEPGAALASALPLPVTVRGGGDALQARAAARQQAAGRGCRLPGRANQPAGHTYTEIHCRQGHAAPHAPPGYGYKRQFL